MSTRDGFAPGVPYWISGTHPDPDGAVAFYGRLFGWEAADRGDFTACSLRGRDVAGIAQGDAAEWRTHVWVESADATAERVAAAGGRVVTTPFDVAGFGRVAVVADPAGAVFAAAQPGEHRGAQLVNEPGAWAMSALTMPDPANAQAFYGSVFGWQADTFAMGDLEVTLWRLPGFVGGEPTQPVPRDLVATGVPGEEPGWSVDFWVGDMDATVETAAQLGGAVLDGPHDLPIGRQARFADPQGATFSVTKIGVG
jgi:uncharacterized protein